MFKRIAGTSESTDDDWITISIDGEDVRVPIGETVATAVMLTEQTRFRSSVVSGSARAPYCLMGVCFECLLTINGVKNRQACMVQVAEGMIVERQIDLTFGARKEQ